MAWQFRVTSLKMWLLRRRTSLAQRGAWSAAIRRAPRRVLGGAVGTKGRAQLIEVAFCLGVILMMMMMN